MFKCNRTEKRFVSIVEEENFPKCCRSKIFKTFQQALFNCVLIDYL